MNILTPLCSLCGMAAEAHPHTGCNVYTTGSAAGWGGGPADVLNMRAELTLLTMRVQALETAQRIPLDGPGSHGWDLGELRAVQEENDRLRAVAKAASALMATVHWDLWTQFPDGPAGGLRILTAERSALREALSDLDAAKVKP